MQGVPDTVPEGGVVPPPLDSAWAESTRKKALLKLEKLDTDLKNYKGNSIKESIRYDGTGHDSSRVLFSASCCYKKTKVSTFLGIVFKRKMKVSRF